MLAIQLRQLWAVHDKGAFDSSVEYSPRRQILALFTEKSFLRYLGKLLVIRPFRYSCVTGVGYDLTVGLFAHVDPFKKKILSIVILPENAESKITLEPNTYGIVISKEHIYLSRWLAGTFHSKSSLAAQAVYLNSTTCDPNWKGRLIFSLYNASGNSVSLDFDTTFTTMCIHEVDRPSKLRPKESKAVIEKYLEGLEGNAKDIVGYVLRDDDLKQKFESEVEGAQRWIKLPRLFLSIWLSIVDVVPFIIKYVSLR
jgi:deoxycytidine triphosphate deaminase